MKSLVIKSGKPVYLVKSINQLRADWDQKFSESPASDDTIKATNAFTDLLMDYLGNPNFGFPDFSLAGAARAIASFFTPAPLRPQYYNIVFKACEQLCFFGGMYANLDEYLTVPFYMAKLKETVSGRDISSDIYLSNILTVTHEKTGIDYASIDVTQIIKDANILEHGHKVSSPNQ